MWDHWQCCKFRLHLKGATSAIHVYLYLAWQYITCRFPFYRHPQQKQYQKTYMHNADVITQLGVRSAAPHLAEFSDSNRACHGYSPSCAGSPPMIWLRGTRCCPQSVPSEEKQLSISTSDAYLRKESLSGPWFGTMNALHVNIHHVLRLSNLKLI